MTITDADLAELERLAEAATRLGIQCTEIQERLEDDDMLGLECADTVALERAMREQRHITISLASSVPALIDALRECRAERDEAESMKAMFRELLAVAEAQRDAARAEVEREHGVAKLLAEHAARLDDEVTRLRDIIRRCRESVECWVPRHEDDRVLLADIAKVLEERV